MVGEPSHPGQLCAALDWPFFGKWNKKASPSGHLGTSCGVTQAEIWPVACSLLPVSLVIIALINHCGDGGGSPVMVWYFSMTWKVKCKCMSLLNLHE